MAQQSSIHTLSSNHRSRSCPLCDPLETQNGPCPPSQTAQQTGALRSLIDGDHPALSALSRRQPAGRRAWHHPPNDLGSALPRRTRTRIVTFRPFPCRCHPHRTHRMAITQHYLRFDNGSLRLVSLGPTLTAAQLPPNGVPPSGHTRHCYRAHPRQSG